MAESEYNGGSLMAESVTYRRSRVNTSVPEQTAFNAQATQRGAMQVSQSLDRMVAFFRQQQAEKIKVEAAEFGAKNAPKGRSCRIWCKERADIGTGASCSRER